MVVVQHLVCGDCRVGGLVSQRHNEVRDAFGDLSSLVWKQAHNEPIVIVCKSNIDDSTSETLIAALGNPKSMPFLMCY